jgi:hypothetical protein
MVNLLVATGLLWVLVKIPSWASRMVFTGGHSSGVLRIIKSIIVAKTLGAAGLLGGIPRGSRSRPVGRARPRPRPGASRPGTSPAGGGRP